ncbi:helix-turn-helix domain-containing protein [Photobacterium leiognathi subsp. mandapamensis]
MSYKTQFELSQLITRTPPKQLGLTPTNKSILLHIVSFMNSSFECYPSVKKISDISGYGEATINRGIKEIVYCKLLTKKNRSNGHIKTSNFYSLNKKELAYRVYGESTTVNKPKEENNSKKEYLAEDGNYYKSPTEYYIHKRSINETLK